jgi:hypothetical protein
VSEENKKTKTYWKWKPNRWWLGLIVFCFISIIGAGVIARIYGQESGFTIMTMMIFAIWAACTDRGWSIPIRIVWIFGIWIIHTLLSLPIAFMLLPFAHSVGPHLVDRGISLFAALPLVVWAMSRSKYFIESAGKKEEKVNL